MLTEQQKLQYLNLESNNPINYANCLIDFKEENNQLSWQDIVNLVEEKYGVFHSRHWYSRYYYNNYLTFTPTDSNAPTKRSIEANITENKNKQDSYHEKLLTLQKEKAKISDEINQNRAYIRRIAREETLKEIALEAVKNIGNKKLLPTYNGPVTVNTSKEAILLLSDWHYGFDFVNPWNTYNPEIARKRISKLLNETIKICKEQEVTNINVLNLADLIAGRIHLTIRLESRIDVITQIMEVSEILAEFLNELTKHFIVTYYSCTDNHSRIEPDKTQSLDLESLCRITDWFLRQRLGNKVNFPTNKFGDDIITFNILGHRVAAVHGHDDKPNKCIDEISLLTRQTYDLICMAHRHHFSMDEKDQCRLVCNGSLMGSDAYAIKLRLHSRPSQTLIITTREKVCDSIHILELN